MRFRAAVQVVLVATVLVASGCSKTEDVAPEKKVFGNSPRVDSFTLLAMTEETVTCDLTQLMRNRLCYQELVGAQEMAPIVISGHYTKVFLEARVEDPDSTPQESDLLLVAGSYINVGDPGKNEKLILLFDDGGPTIKLEPQKDMVNGLNCTSEPDPETGFCKCQAKTFELNSGDPVARDNIFTRGFAIIDAGTPPDLLDCLHDANRQSLQIITPPGSTLEFRLDAVDRRGNVDTFPVKKTLVTGDFNDENPRLICTGDPCGCCLFEHPQTYTLECGGIEGMRGPPGSFFESGACKLFG